MAYVSTDVDMSNMALANLGVQRVILAMTETSSEAKACNRFYNLTLSKLLQDFEWPHARRRVTLTVTDATVLGWTYAYRYPTLTEAVRRLDQSVRTPTNEGRIPFEIEERIVATGYTGRAVVTDLKDAVAVTTCAKDTGSSQNLESAWPASFVEVFSWALAAAIAPALNVEASRRKLAQEMAIFTYRQAMARYTLEQQEEAKPDSEYITVRS